MADFVLILELFGGVILLFGVGWLIGHLLRLDKVDEEMQNKRSKNLI